VAAEGFIDGDTDKPRGERRTASELRQVLIGTDVLGLHDVLGLRVVARDGACCPVEALVVAADEDFKEGSLAGQNACDYLFVADGGDYGLRGRQVGPFLPLDTQEWGSAKRLQDGEKYFFADKV